MRWIPLCLGLLMLFSCKKEEHPIPSIEAEWLDDSGPFGFGQTIAVKVHAQIEGADPIEKITVQLTDENQKVWMSEMSTSQLPSHEFHGNISLTLEDPYLPSGQYYLKISALTAHQSKSTFLQCSITELSKKRTLVIGINNNGFAGAMIDTLSSGFELAPWNSALGARYLPIINHYNKTLWTCIPGQSLLEITGIADQYIQTYNYPFAGSNDYYLDAVYDAQDLSIWYITQDGLRQFDKNSQFRQWIPISNGHLMECTEDFICTNKKTPGQPQELLLHLKTTGSLAHVWVHGKQVSDLFVLDNMMGLLYLENGNYKIGLFDLDTFLPINWHPLLSYSSNGFLCAAARDGLWISDENGLHHWDNQGNWNNTWPNYHPTQFEIDQTSPLIWMIDEGKIKAFQYLSQQEMYQSADNGYSSLAIGYNK